MIGAIVAGGLSAGTPPITNSYESIATVTVGSGGSSSISFTSIPSTYKHLQIRAILRSTYAGSSDFMSMKLNSDGTAANYAVHKLQGNGSAASASASVGDFYLPLDYPANTATASTYSALIIDVLDYANTSKNKTFRILSGYDANGSGAVYLDSSLWMSTSAINSITFQDYTVYGANFQQYSSFALYGIKG